MADAPKESQKTTVVAKIQDVAPVRVTTPSMIVKVRNEAHQREVIANMPKRGKTGL
jgi:ribosome maturation protein Sdo1